MRRQATASSAGSKRQATGLGRTFRGANVTREASLRADGSSALSGFPRVRLSLLALAVAALLAMVFASAAQATKYVDSFFGNPTTSTTASTGGLFNQPRGVAVNNSGTGGAGAGDVYVVDGSKHRVQQFSANGAFIRTWGTDVVNAGAPNDLGTAAFEVCDTTTGNTAADCKIGVTTGTGTGGQLNNPQGITVDQASGHVYVTEGGRFRVQEFTATGQFVRAFGQDVVVPGGTGEQTVLLDEEQSVTLTSVFGVITGGTFTLTFEGQTTAPVAFDASKATVDAALESLSTIGAGNVSVSGQAGGPWVVLFTGTLGDVNVPQLTGDATNLVGTGFGNEVAITTSQPGGSTPGFEVCAIAAECKAGIAGSIGGAFGSTFDGYPAVAPAGAPNAANLLVADPGNRRVQEFTAAGAFVRAFGWDVVSSGPGDGANGTFELCVAAAGDACRAGTPTVGEDTTPAGQFVNGYPKRVAVDTAGAVYANDVPTGELQRVQKFTPQAGPTLSPAVFTTHSGTVADVVSNVTNGNLFVVQSIANSSDVCNPSVGAERRVFEYDSAGNLKDTHLTCATLNSANGLAYAPASDRLYLASQSGGAGGGNIHRVYILDNDGITPIASATVNNATNVTSTTADLSGQVNPNSVGNSFATNWRIEISRNGTAWTSVGGGQLPAATSPSTVSASAVDLLPNTLYRTRVVTSKPFGNPAALSPEGTFLTDAVPPTVSGVGVDSIGDTSARLRGFVNPNSTATTYRFEYGIGNLDTVVPVPEGTVGSGPDPVFVAQQLSGLVPNATYKFRLVASSATEGAMSSPVKTFTTGSAPAANQARAYELVSNADKPTGPGLGVHAFNNELEGQTGVYSGVAAARSDRFVSGSTYGAILTDDGQSTYAEDNAMSTRTPTGWKAKSLFNRFDHANSLYASSLRIALASADLDLMVIGNNTGGAAQLFPEIQGHGGNKRYLRDIDGNWRLLDPYEVSYDGWSSNISGASMGIALSGDGRHAALTTNNWGTLGPGDPTQDQTGGALVAGLVDISDGISDTFADRGITANLGVCAGEGEERTSIPNVSAGKLQAKACPPPAPGRDAALIDRRGSALKGAGVSPLTNILSWDGSRAFFLSPDTENAPCTGSEASTACPTQLYVRQENPDGSEATRWISRPDVTNQDASLLGVTHFQGATPHGDSVFFNTNTPLVADDRNGTGTAPPGGITTGPASSTSWDLYRYDLPSDASGKPNGADPEDGTLTRISAGPTGEGDCNVALGGTTTAPSHPLRFVSDDGNRVLFTCAAPLPGVPAPVDGTTTVPGGTPTSSDMANLYLYDGSREKAERWEFIARLPRANPTFNGVNFLSACATTNGGDGNWGISDFLGGSSQRNCVQGTPDGRFVTFWTPGRLTADDPDTSSMDFYAYDAEKRELTRITAPQGGVGGTYACSPAEPSVRCYGDGGWGSASHYGDNPYLATDPLVDGDRVAYFQSRSRLVAEDTDEFMDVYEWRNGELLIVTAGITDAHAFYSSNDASGQDVFFITDKRLTWQDIDEVRDAYTARVGGGFPQPPPSVMCDVLGGTCQVSGENLPSAGVPASASIGGAGNVISRRVARCKKNQVRKQGKCVKKKPKRTKRAHRRAGK